jgi:MFS family permease
MTVETARAGLGSVLRNRHFLRLWLAQVISQTIMNAANYGLLVLIAELTGSTMLVGLVIITFSLPSVLFGAPAGALVDRLDKRRVLWISNLLRGFLTLGFVASLIMNQGWLLPIYLITFLISLVSQFFTPTEGASIPLLVRNTELVSALSLFNLTVTLSQALGFILLGPLVLTLIPDMTIHAGAFHLLLSSVAQLFLLIALLYFVCTGLVATLPYAALACERTTRRQHFNMREHLASIWMEVHESWQFVRSSRRLMDAVLQLSLGGAILLVIGELSTNLVQHLLNRPATDAALVFLPAGVGLVLGSAFMPRLTKYLNKSLAIVIGIFGLAIDMAALPLFQSAMRHFDPVGWSSSPFFLLVVVAITFTAGLELDLINIPAQTLMQELTPDRVKGRVLALQLMLYNTVSIPVLLFIGAIADVFGISRVLYVLAGLLLVIGLLSARRNKRLPDRTSAPMRQLPRGNASEFLPEAQESSRKQGMREYLQRSPNR